MVAPSNESSEETVQVATCVPANAGTASPFLFLECGDRLFLGVDDLANAVQADQVEDCARGSCDPAQFQIAAGFGDVFQARQDRAATAAVHERHPAQFQHHLVTVGQ